MLQLQDNSMTPLSPSGFNFHLCIINLLFISNKTLRKKQGVSFLMSVLAMIFLKNLTPKAKATKAKIIN